MTLVPEDMKKGILNLPASTRSRSDWRLEPSKGRAPQTSTYSTTPRLCNEGALLGVPSVLELQTNSGLLRDCKTSNFAKVKVSYCHTSPTIKNFDPEFKTW